MLCRRGHVLIVLFIIVMALWLAIVSCDSPAPTATLLPPTAEPPPPTSALVPPTAAPPPLTEPAPTAAPVQRRSKPLAAFSTANFTGSGMCAVCHSELVDEAGNDVSIDAQWRSAMMANAARDPLFLAKVSSEIARHPALQAVIEDKCSLCHMPMAYTEAEVEGETSAMFDPGFLGADHPLHDAAMDGVSCTLCHQIKDQDLGTAATFSGKFPIDTTTEPPDRPNYGPFPNPLADTMRRIVGYTPLQGGQVHDAGLCGTCHTLFTPYVDGEGNVAGEFPEQTPFLEWQHSAYAQDQQPCQQCHMPAAIGGVPISNRPRPPRIPARSPFAQHHFVGGNAFIINMLKSNVDELGLTCSAEHLEATLGRVLNQLQNKSVDLSLANAEIEDNTLNLTLRLESKVGHKFPSGFPSRRAWIHLKVTDASGNVVFESGQPQPDGSIVSSDADESATAYETHYDVISAPEQVQIYESIMHDVAGELTWTLLAAAGYTKDNRIVPLGFDKETAGADFKVYGLAAQDNNFDHGSDQVHYQVSMQGYTIPFVVTVELLYQTVSYRFAQDLAQDDTPQVERFMGYYQEADKTPVVIARIEETVR